MRKQKSGIIVNKGSEWWGINYTTLTDLFVKNYNEYVEHLTKEYCIDI